MAVVLIKSKTLSIVVEEIDTAKMDEKTLIRKVLQAIPQADWFDPRQKKGRRDREETGC